jgi:hypothetical protein
MVRSRSSMSFYTSLLGKLYDRGSEKELGKGINFTGGLALRSDPATQLLEVYATGEVGTVTTADFTQPAVDGDVSVEVISTASLLVGAVVYVVGGGYYTVDSVTDETTVVLTNRGDDVNADPSEVIASGAQISTAGPAGAAGAPGADGAAGVDGAPGAVGPGLVERTPRVSVLLRTTLNVANLAACSTTQDGVVIPGANYVILLAAQTTASENGYYLTGTPGGGTCALTKITSLDPCRASGTGILTFVRSGTANGGTFCRYNATNVIAAETGIGLPTYVCDLVDFWATGDGNDYAPAVARAQEAGRAGLGQMIVTAHRLPEYQFATPCLITTGIEIVSNGGCFTTGSTLLKFTTSGFLSTSGLSGSAAIANGGLRLTNCTIQGPGDGLSADYSALDATVQCKLDNVQIQNFPGRGIYQRGSTTDDFATINTTTTADFTQPAIGATVTAQVASSAGLTVGTVIRIAGGGYYRVTAVPDGTHATLFNYGFANSTAYAPANAAPAATVASGASLRGVLSNVNGATFKNIRLVTTGKTGWYISGDNANQLVVSGLKISNCGTRAIAGDNHGGVEASFLGNLYESIQIVGCTHDVQIGSVATTATFVQPRITSKIPTSPADATADIAVKTVTIAVSDSTLLPVATFFRIGTAAGAGLYVVVAVVSGTSIKANCLRQESGFGTGVTVPISGIYTPAYGFLSVGASNRSHFENGYTENSDVVYVGGLNTVEGGRFGNIGQAAGFGAGSGGTQINSPTMITSGSYDVVRAFCPQGTDNLETFSNLNDASGYTIGWRQSTNYWQCIHAGLTSLTAWYLTGVSHTFGGGFMGFSRGILLAGQRYTIDIEANLPANSSAASTYIVGSMIVNNAATGPLGWTVTVRSPDTNVGALTWVPLWGIDGQASVALTDADATIAVGAGRVYEAAAALLTANRIKTLGTTGARNGDLMRVTRRDLSAFALSITNGGGGGGTTRLPGNSWQLYRYDGTNWILRGGGQLAPLKLENQDFAFSNPLATVTEETKTVNTLTGAAVGDTVQACPRAALPAGITIDYVRVSAANTVEIRLYNRSGGGVDCSGIRWDVSIAGKV